MNDKSYVTMERKKCAICDAEYDSGAILLDRCLRQKFDRYTLTGFGVCPACFKEGYIPLVETDPARSGPGSFHKTGTVVHVRKSVWSNIFNVPIPECGFMFTDPETVKKLQTL